ncbi:hypothetical protein [Streptomyces albidoflavus]|uniref:hypothetical protein n=1 Tax=Streptomyces albidoflavus TaxID=1886 RepID=UPI002F907BE3|nr:hypothetical protein OH810_31370 [Streptomyces albidoflavus]WTD45888.1 hypothetical protein OH730_30645 [Streptomyces albidoflavus]WTD86222.1 hypothetical protein OHA92_31355 [Streptomyces albidoflavus]
MDDSSLSDHVETCDARVSGPDDPEFCTKPAAFEIDRLLDTSLISCPDHLGPLLLGANNVLWPPQVQLLDANEHPEKAVVIGSAEAKRRETEFVKSLGVGYGRRR